MKIKRVIIETENGTTLVADGRAIEQVEIETQYGIGPEGGISYRVRHTGFNTLKITLVAIYRYFDPAMASEEVAPGEPKAIEQN